jgi:itaconate CoA-transferase
VARAYVATLADVREEHAVDIVPGGRPLDGVLVVALEQAVAAPFATRHLADLGARVIKIERPGRGDFARDYDSAAGVLAVTGSQDAPAKAGISVADIAGGMYAYSGILSALLQRERTGRGGTVKVSLFDALAEWMSNPLQLARLTGKAPERTGARHATILPYGGYLTADGDEVMLAVQNEPEWARLCGDVLGVPDMLDRRFAGNQHRMDHREEVEQRLAAAVARLSTGDLLDRLERAGLPYASAKSVQEVVDHPQLASRWTPVTAGDRSVDVLPPPVRHGGFGPVLGPVPAHGRDTAAVLAEFAPGPSDADSA